MYQEKKEKKTKSSWIQFMLRSILALLVIVLSVKLVSMIIDNHNKQKNENTMKNNLTEMMKVAKDYFQDNELPEETGKSTTISLKDLIDKDLIESIKDEDGRTCDVEQSFIKVTRLEKEYQYKVYLVCGDEVDYLNEFKDIDSEKEDQPNEEDTTTTTTTTTTTKTTTTTTKKTTTKKVTTTKKEEVYTVAFNSNGGSTVATQQVKANEKAKNITPTRAGYKFVGWYYHGSKFDFNTKINKDYILVAKWTK